jgi:hypothetical protein
MPSETFLRPSEGYLYKPNLKPLPSHSGLKVQIQTTSRCNGKCVICPYIESWHNHNPGRMSDEIFDRMLLQLKNKQLSKICLYLQNEPLLDPQFLERLKKISSELQFGHIEISTNASPLTPEYSKQLVRVLEGTRHELWVSFHGCDERTYSGMMGLNFHKTLTNILYLLQLSQSMPLRIAIRGAGKGISPNLNTPYDFSEHDFRVFWHTQFQAQDLKILPGLFYHPYNSRSGGILRNELKHCSIVRPDLKGFTCSRINNWLHFLYTGELAICCMDYHREEIFGDIRKQPIDDILQNQAYINLKKKVEGDIYSAPTFICKRCTQPGD